MITRTSILDFFSRTKIIFATIAAVITFSITLYNQFKSNHATEISGIVTTNKGYISPVDAVVRISSPIQAQTETDAQGRFKFKLQNLQSDTFLLIVQNKRTNTVTKQNEYVMRRMAGRISSSPLTRICVTAGSIRPMIPRTRAGGMARA
jgi:hypothetical protein